MTATVLTENRFPVLLYHRIADDPGDPFAVPRARFAEQLGMICASRRTSLTVGELADGLRGRRPLAARGVAITFDDGYRDTPEAVALLREHGLRATVYLTAGQLEEPLMMSVSQLRELAAIGADVQLGAHSVSHPYLDALAPDAVRTEVQHSRRILEDHIDRSIDSFAYPHGAYDARVREAVLEAGYGSAAAVKNAISHHRDDPWAIARYTVTARTSARTMDALLHGCGAPLAWGHERLRTRAARSARRLRQRTPGASWIRGTSRSAGRRRP
jgi:peptidoglycan/xylan/chitin deacetylase (PgdA/CDA1 family)